MRLTKGDVIIFFNCFDQCYEISFLEFIKEASILGCKIIPVALLGDTRRPPDCISKYQSYDVKEELRRRSLTDAHIQTIATALARNVVAYLQPTLTKSNM